MIRTTIHATLDCDIHSVWQAVTDLSRSDWRSDLKKIEIVDENTFIEYTKKGYLTIFTVTAKEPEKQYEFDIKNSNMTGHWTGIFIDDGVRTRIEFTEAVTVRNPLMRLFAKGYLKKQQALYVSDLKKFLNAGS